MGISIDTSERIESERQLMKSKETIETTLEHIVNIMPGHVYWQDCNIKFLGCNQAQAEQEKLKNSTLLSAAIAHEMRTPFATLTASSQSLKRLIPKLATLVDKAEAAGIDSGVRRADLEALTEIPDEQVNTIAAANNFINLLLQSFEESNPKKLEPLSAQHCVQDALKQYPQPQLKLVEIQTTLAPDFTFQGDASTFQHVLFNLLKNAIHYVQKAQKGNIQIWTELGKHYNTLHFKDTGTGITADDLPRIFDHFFSKSRHGTGIGLAFAQLAIEKIGGRIECDSTEGEFTHFRILLPVKWQQ